MVGFFRPFFLKRKKRKDLPIFGAMVKESPKRKKSSKATKTASMVQPPKKKGLVKTPVRLFQAILSQLLRRKTGDTLEGRLGYRFRNPELLAQSMVHRSWISGRELEYWQTNERLEFLGDSVLNMLVTEYLYIHYPKLPEGELSKKKGAIVSGKALAESARAWNLGEFLRVGKGEAKAGGRDRESLLADAFEAVLGAVYLDAGVEPVRKILEKVHYPRIAHILSDAEFINYKSLLLESLQARGQEHPRYSVIKENGPEHKKEFVIQVLVQNEVKGHGRGPSKKRAEQDAAREALQNMGLETVDLEGNLK